VVFDTLNRLKWTGKLGNCSVTILHRGAPGDRKVIGGEQITQIKRGHFYYTSNNREILIPLHRVLEVSVDGESVWKRKTLKG